MKLSRAQVAMLEAARRMGWVHPTSANDRRTAAVLLRAHLLEVHPEYDGETILRSAEVAENAVFDLESAPAPIFIGRYLRTVEDAVEYERFDGSLGMAPADCVEVRRRTDVASDDNL